MIVDALLAVCGSITGNSVTVPIHPYEIEALRINYSEQQPAVR